MTLIIFSGLPGVGKTTLAQGLARELGAVYLRIDTIEQAMLGPGRLQSPGEEGYRVAYAVAEENLRMGRIVVADSVNPLWITRQAWRDAASRAGERFVDVAIRCSDRAEHRRRVETRKTDVPGLRPPTWQDVIEREFEAWDDESVEIDTAGQSIEQSYAALRTALSVYGAT
jgi:predicted kinase